MHRQFLLRFVLPAAAVWAAAVDTRAFGVGPDVSGIVVDESGVPVSGANVTTLGVPGGGATASAADGTFRLAVTATARGPHDDDVCIIRADSGEQVGIAVANIGTSGPLRVLLKAPRTVRVTVVDGETNPVPAASVEVLVRRIVTASGETDATGSWIGSVPADAVDLPGWGIIARKSGVGLDYAESRPPTEPATQDGTAVRLVLDGVRPLQIKVVTTDRRPVSGVAVGPVSLHKPGRNRPVALSPFSWPVTDAEGGANLDWLPTWFDQPVDIAVSGRALAGRTLIDPAVALSAATATVHPVSSIAGRVIGPDGQPVAGAVVTARYLPPVAAGTAFTVLADSEGRFSAERTVASLVLRTASPDGSLVRTTTVPAEAQDADISLRPAATVSGRALSADGEAIAGRMLVCVALLPSDGTRNEVASTFGETVTTDESGRFSLGGLVPGDRYRLFVPGTGETAVLSTFTAPFGRSDLGVLKLVASSTPSTGPATRPAPSGPPGVLYVEPGGSFAAEFFRDFRSKTFNDATLNVLGPKGLMKSGSSGLTISVPRGRAPEAERVGVGYALPLLGDCDIRATVELLPFSPSEGGYGTGVILAVEDAVDRGATLQFLRGGDGKRSYVAHHFVRDAGGNYEHKVKSFPTSKSVAVLRLRRDGSTVRFLVSEDRAKSFRELDAIEFTDRPLKVVQAYGQRGGKPNELAARLLDLRIGMGRVALRSEAFVPPPPPSRSWPWWAAGATAGFVAVILGGFWYRRRYF